MAEEREQALQDVNLQDLKAFVRVFCRYAAASLIHGNVYRQEALKLAVVIKSNLYRSGDGKSSVLAEVARLAALKQTPQWHIPVDHNDQAVVLYVQGGEATDTDWAHMALARQILRAPFFNELRTEKQLGYIVFAGSMSLKEVPASVLVVQSPTAQVAELQQEIGQFLVRQSFTEEILDQNRQAVLANLLERPKNLAEQSERYWSNIVHGVDGFDRRQRLAKALEAINLESLQAYYERLFV